MEYEIGGGVDDLEENDTWEPTQTQMQVKQYIPPQLSQKQSLPIKVQIEQNDQSKKSKQDDQIKQNQSKSDFPQQSNVRVNITANQQQSSNNLQKQTKLQQLSTFDSSTFQVKQNDNQITPKSEQDISKLPLNLMKNVQNNQVHKSQSASNVLSFKNDQQEQKVNSNQFIQNQSNQQATITKFQQQNQNNLINHNINSNNQNVTQNITYSQPLGQINQNYIQINPQPSKIDTQPFEEFQPPVKEKGLMKKPFKTGGLTQIAPPPQTQIITNKSYSPINSSINNDLSQEPIEEQEEEHDEDQNENNGFNQQRLNKNQNFNNRNYSVESSNNGQGQKEEKIIVHNKNLLFDLIPEEKINKQKEQQTINPTEDQKKNIGKVNKGGLAALKKQGSQQTKVNTIQKLQNIQEKPEQQSYSKIQKNVKFNKQNQQILENDLEQENQQDQKPSNLKNKAEKQSIESSNFSPQIQVQQPLNQINIVSNSNQYNTYQPPPQVQPFIQQPQMMIPFPQMINQIPNNQQAPSSYTEQLQQQLNMIMQMHQQLSQQLTVQNGIAANPFSLNQQFVNPSNLNQPNTQIQNHQQNPYQQQNFLSQSPQNIQASNSNLTFGLQQQLSQNQQSNMNQGRVIAKPVISQMTVNSQNAFKQNYPADSLLGQFKDQLVQQVDDQPRPKLNNFALNQPNINPQNYQSNSDILSQDKRKQYSMSQDNFQGKNNSRISNFAMGNNAIGYGNQSDGTALTNYMDQSANKSQISQTSSNYHQRNNYNLLPQSQPSSTSTNQNFRSERLSQNQPHKKAESQTDAFKQRQKPQSQVRPSETSSKTGQSIINFRPYSMKDYNNMQQTSVQQKLGGLGANIGSDDWVKAKQKKDQQLEFAQNVKMQNQVTIKTQQQQQMSKPPKPIEPKEKTAREKAIEFAKNNVPKPKVKQDASKDQDQNAALIKNNKTNNRVNIDNDFGIDDNTDFGQLENKPVGSYNQKGYDIAMLDQKHDAYTDEVEKIKRAFNIKI